MNYPFFHLETFSTISQMKLQHLSPILWTKNLEETRSFYETVLGFTSRGNFPNYIAFSRDHVEIMFIIPQNEPEECKDPDNQEEFFPKPLLTGSLYFFTDDVDELWDMVKDKAKVKTAIEDREYKMRDFSILDNNGYELVFGKDISKQELNL